MRMPHVFHGTDKAIWSRIRTRTLLAMSLGGATFFGARVSGHDPSTGVSGKPFEKATETSWIPVDEDHDRGCAACQGAQFMDSETSPRGFRP